VSQTQKFHSDTNWLMSVGNKARLLATFYRTYWLAAWFINLCCISITWQYGASVVAPVTWLKVVAMAVILYSINAWRSKEYYYYHNLGISKWMLWATTLGFDFSAFVCCIIFTLSLQ
jgi:hypothetical protein